MKIFILRIALLMITVRAQNEVQCQNDCNKNGICKNGRCFCYENFIGNTCYTLAYQIDDSNDQELQLYNHPIFFYINLSKYQNQRLELNLSTFDQDGISLYMQKTETSYFYYQKETYMIQIQEEIIDFKTPLNLTIDVPSDEFYGRLVVRAWLINYTQHNVTPINSSNNNSFPTIIIIVIVISIVVAIIIITTLYCIFKTLRRRRMEQAAQLRNDKQHSSNIHHNLIQIKPHEFNLDETCSICLENLLNGKELSQTQCKHNFHNECILLWMAKNFECPICRNKFFQNKK